MFASQKAYISSLKASSPVQRQIRATAEGNLAVSSVLPSSASDPKKTEPSVTTSWTTLPELAVVRLADVPQRPQVVLYGPELPGGDAREGGELAVGAEEPR